MKEKLLYESNEHLDIEQICNILSENKIPYIKKEEGSGQYMNIAMGTSFQNEKIYVDEQKLDEANNLIQNFINIKDDNENNEEDSESELKQARNLRKLVGFICLGFPAIVIIVIIVCMIIGVI